jgi:hypothetical protein
MSNIKVIIIITALFFNHIALAGIINGDFSACDYSGWQTDTDGGTGTSNDFLINNNGGDCNAEIQADYFSPAGDPFGAPLNDVWLANTLFQGLDFTGATSSTWLLSIDYQVNSEITSNDPLFIADYFLFFLSDGSFNTFDETGGIGSLVVKTDIDGLFTQTLTFELANSFTNTSGWSLNLELGIGADNFGWSDAFGSSLLINEVSLIEKLANVAQVPEPSTLVIFIFSPSHSNFLRA